MADWTYNDRELRETIGRLAEMTGKAMEDVIRDQTRPFVRDANAVTPPFGKSPARESQGDKRRAGENAIENDIRRAFSAVDSLRFYESDSPLGQGIRRATKSGNTLLAEHLIKKAMPRARFAGVLQSPDKEMHKRMRNHRGRVPKSAGFFILGGKRKLAAYIKKEQKKSGLGKAGWNEADVALGKTPPPWLRRHYKSDGIYMESFGGSTPSVVVGNRVPHVQDSYTRINDFAWRSRIRNANKQADALERSARRRMRELKIA